MLFIVNSYDSPMNTTVHHEEQLKYDFYSAECVSIFGSARTKPEDKYYKKTILVTRQYFTY